ncbi:MAG: hypothetical protein ACTIIR_09125, partial [Halomonas sp.]
MFGIKSKTTPKTSEHSSELSSELSSEQGASNSALNQHFWMPFSANRDFHANPRIITGAEGRYYIDD